MKRFILMCAAAVSIGTAALAVDDIATTTTGPVPANKSLREMSEAERAAFWARLPEEDKQRIIAKRQQLEAAKAKETGKPGSTPAATAQTLPQGDDLNARIARGKAAWEAMSDEQKRQFIMDNEDAIRASTEAAQKNMGVVPNR